MKRSPLARTSRLARGGPFRRANTSRRRKLRAQQHGTQARSQWWRDQPCVCQGEHPACTGGWSEPSHVVSRGAGGTAADIVPMSRGCHQAWHDHGQLSYCASIRILVNDGARFVEARAPARLGAVTTLGALRHLARTHYATQGPDAPRGETT